MVKDILVNDFSREKEKIDREIFINLENLVVLFLIVVLKKIYVDDLVVSIILLLKEIWKDTNLKGIVSVREKREAQVKKHVDIINVLFLQVTDKDNLNRIVLLD